MTVYDEIVKAIEEELEKCSKPKYITDIPGDLRTTNPDILTQRVGKLETLLYETRDERDKVREQAKKAKEVVESIINDIDGKNSKLYEPIGQLHTMFRNGEIEDDGSKEYKELHKLIERNGVELYGLMGDVEYNAVPKGAYYLENAEFTDLSTDYLDRNLSKIINNSNRLGLDINWSNAEDILKDMKKDIKAYNTSKNSFHQLRDEMIELDKKDDIVSEELISTMDKLLENLPSP